MSLDICSPTRTTMATLYYLRCSTDSQTTESQRSALGIPSDVDPGHVFMDEGVSGAVDALDRPAFAKCAAYARSGDVLRVTALDRLGRNAIDVQQTLKTKLDREFRKYVILGACNPALADRALHAELEIGLLLPCNVVVYETGSGQSVIAAMAPLSALGVVGANPELQEVAKEADARLRRALTALESAAPA